MKVPRILHDFSNAFHDSGHECYLVGGAVRNMIAGFEVTDYDFATDALPEEVMKLFKRVIPTGIKHGTVTVLFRHHKFEVTTYRTEGTYSDGRRPDTIEYLPSIEEDLKRRDFSINSLALNLHTGELLDLHGGREDIKNGLIRAIGTPDERFKEDPLRIMRACRFAAQLDFSIEEHTFDAAARLSDRIRSVSAERIRDEFEKILLSDIPSKGIHSMDRTGILDIIIPEMSEGKGVLQKGFHDFDVFTHSLYSCDSAPKDLIVRLAALFHDIGKPRAISYDEEGIPSFHRHEQLSAAMTRRILDRLKFPRSVERTVIHLIEQHMFHYQDQWSDSAVRRFVSRVGKESIGRLFQLRIADAEGMSERRMHPYKLDELKVRVDEVITKDNAFTVKDLAVDGNDLARDAGVPKGPEMGVVLDFLLESVLDDPELNTREKLIDIARRYYESHVAVE
ncbi:MAG: CCA tRNA nucleotidyltransferase [Spirochaetia bacterium]